MHLLSRLLARRRRFWAILRDTARGVLADGFTHAGNLAYLSLLTLFPFFIVVATVAGSLGRTEDGLKAVTAFLRAVPPEVARLVAGPITEVISVRASSGVLTLGILVTLWSVTGFMETIRAIIREAYGAPNIAALWKTRLGSLAVVFLAVVAMLAALAAQVLVTGVEAVVEGLFPLADDLLAALGFGRLLPAAILFIAIYAVFLVLTPRRFRVTRAPIWPGAAVTTLTWVGTTMLMPMVLGWVGGYTLTYGSLAGVIVALLFFYIVGLGLVVGANLNAALAKARQSQLKAIAASLE